MNFSTYCNSKLQDSFSFSSSDNLLSLLRRPLIIEEDDASPHFRPPMSFEDPFEDPGMEPIPSKARLPRMAETNEWNQQDSQDSYLSQDLIDTLDSVTDLFEPKRGIEALFDHQDSDQFRSKKRQRTSSPSTVLAAPYSSEEITARFRPYQEQQWQEQYQRLVQYKLEHGHCCVPHFFPAEPTLARWVKRQRYQYKKFNDGDVTSTMTQHRINELESVGFVWHSHMAAWYEKFNELNAFKQRTGHCNVPSKYAENVALSTWVKCQRRQFKLVASGKSSSMTFERIQELKSLGFAFDGRQQKSTLVSF